MIVRSTIENVLKIEGLDLPDPSVPMSVFQVIKVGFVVIGFPFKNDVPISPIMVFIFKKIDEVIEKI